MSDEKKPVEAETSKKRQRRTLVLRSMLPEKDVLIKEVLSKKKGETYHIARLFGYVSEAVSKATDFGDGRSVEIISLAGFFRTDKGASYSTITLPQAYSKAIAKLLESVSLAKIDVNIVLRNTGNAGSPYEWVVNLDADDAGSDAMAVFSAPK